MTRIYIASKTCHAPRWIALRAEGVNIISTWIDEAGKGKTSNFEDLWLRCIDEATFADVLIIYREREEILKGAYIEVGCALAACRQVLAVGCEQLSFTYHPLVTRVPDLALAVRIAQTLNRVPG